MWKSMFYFLRTHRNPFESIVRHTSVRPASSQLRTHEVQLSALLDHAPPRRTRFSTWSDLDVPDVLTPADVPIDYCDALGMPVLCSCCAVREASSS